MSGICASGEFNCGIKFCVVAVLNCGCVVGCCCTNAPLCRQLFGSDDVSGSCLTVFMLMLSALKSPSGYMFASNVLFKIQSKSNSSSGVVLA